MGCQTLEGPQALALVRSRHVYYFTAGQTPDYEAIKEANDSGAYYTSDSGGTYDGTGDLGRIVRVHLFLKALAEQVAAGARDRKPDHRQRPDRCRRSEPDRRPEP